MPLIPGYFDGGGYKFPNGHYRPTSRTPVTHPYAADSVWNIGFGTNTVFEGNTGRTAKLLTSGYGRNINGNNSGGIWSVQAVEASVTDPLITLTTTQAPTGTYSDLFRAPASINPDGTGDGWWTILQPDGTYFDVYRLKRTGATTFEGLYYYSSSATGYAYLGGTRASNIPLRVGAMHHYEFDRVAKGGHFGHALAASLPYPILKTLPDATDGKLVAVNGSGQGYIWPSHGADSSAVYGNPTDAIAMGSWWGIPGSVDIKSLGLGTWGYELAYTLQNYGMCVLAATDDIVALYATPEVEIQRPSELADMRSAWASSVLFPLLRRVTGTNNPPSTTWNAPQPPTNELSYVLGGSPRRVPAPPAFV